MARMSDLSANHRLEEGWEPQANQEWWRPMGDYLEIKGDDIRDPFVSCPIEPPHFRVNNATREGINLRRDFFESFGKMARSKVW